MGAGGVIGVLSLLGLVGGAAYALSDHGHSGSAPATGGQAGSPQDERSLSTVRFWNGSFWVYAEKEALIPPSYNALRGYMVTAEQQFPDGTKVWTLTPKPQQMPENTQLQDAVDGWKSIGYSLLMSWSMPFPQATTKKLMLVPPNVNPWTLDTSSDVVVFFAPVAWPPPSGIYTGIPSQAKPIRQPDDPAVPDSPDDDVDLPPEIHDAVSDVFKRGKPIEMEQLAKTLDAGGYKKASVWARAWAKKFRTARAIKAQNEGGYDYALRENELPPYYFSQAWWGDGYGSRYTEIVKANPGKLSQGASGVSGWTASTVIKIPAQWGDPYDRPAIPLGHGKAPPKKKEDKKKDPVVSAQPDDPSVIYRKPPPSGGLGNPTVYASDDDDPGPLGNIWAMIDSTSPAEKYK